VSVLVVGANTVLELGAVRLSVSAPSGSVDLFVFQLDVGRRVRSDADLVFFNSPVSPEGAVRLLDGVTAQVDLAGVPADVAVLSFAVAASDEGFGGGPASLGQIAGMTVQIHAGPESSAGAVYTAPVNRLSTERAAVLVEMYRHGGGWKLRNVCAGWTEGLAALLREHGVTVDEAPEETPAPAPAPLAQPKPEREPVARAAPGEDRLSLAKREKLDLRKREVTKVLLTKGTPAAQARVVLVLDKTGSMRRAYSTGVVSRVVERMVPVAATLDDDGALECYLYARRFAKLPDVHADTVTEWSEQYLHLSGHHGGIDYDDLGAANDEPPILREIITGLRRGAAMPTLVLFFTDGGFGQRREITALITKAAGLPAFFQFVGVGRANYGLLERLDDLAGREVDNVGFFALDDVDTVSDAELYTRLLGEFPDWLRAARSAGIVT